MASDFIDYLPEVLQALGQVRSKRMFGGTGTYINKLFCALIADDFQCNIKTGPSLGIKGTLFGV